MKGGRKCSGGLQYWLKASFCRNVDAGLAKIIYCFHVQGMPANFGAPWSRNEKEDAECKPRTTRTTRKNRQGENVSRGGAEKKRNYLATEHRKDKTKRRGTGCRKKAQRAQKRAFVSNGTCIKRGASYWCIANSEILYKGAWSESAKNIGKKLLPFVRHYT